MSNDEFIFWELIDSLQEDKFKFFNGVLNINEEIFVKQVEKLKLYVPKIKDEKIRKVAISFINEVFNHKNYFIYKEQEKIRAKKRQHVEKMLSLIKKDKEVSENLVEKFRFLLKNNDFNSIEKLYLDNKALIDKHQPKFTKYWESLPRNIDNDSYILSCKKILKDRKIKNLVHFTNVDNLNSILEKGLMPRETLEQKQIKYYFNDKIRLENKLNCICLSIEYPNKYLLDIFKAKYNKKYCIVILDAESVLLNNNNKKYYVYCNAAREDARRWLQDDTLCQDRYLNALFIEDNPDNRDFCQYSRSSKQLKDYLPTNEQAEILYQGIIPVSYIKSIYFENSEDIEFFKQTISNKDLISNISLEINNDFFTKDRDNINWEER